VIGDAAQSFGATRSGRLGGTFGNCGVVRCGPGKSLAGAAGGVLVTNDVAMYQRAVSLGLGTEQAPRVTRRALGFWFWRRFRALTFPLEMVVGHFFRSHSTEEPHTSATLSNFDAA